MIGEDIWCVVVNGVVYKRDLSRRKAEAIAEEHQRGLCKHKDFGDHVEVRRDTQTIQDVDVMYQTARRGERQTYQFIGYKE